MAVIQGNAHKSSVSGFYPKTINGSLRFNKDDASLLTLTPNSAGSRTTWTYSTWVKLSVLPSSSSNDIFLLTSASGSTETTTYINGINGRIEFYHYNGSGFDFIVKTNNFLRDPSAWYHLVIVLDTTNATASERQRIYINGVAVTSWDTQSNSSQNFANGLINNTTAQNIGGWQGTGKFDGYMAEVHFTDGTAYDADAFGEFKEGVWVAKAPDVTYGTNGFHLTFEDDTEVEAFNTTLHRGNGAEQSITGTGFSPDLVWVKNRDQADNHMLYDTVRGPKRFLNSNGTGAESYSTNDLESFDADGFTVQNDPRLNTSGEAFVAWQWDAGANNAVTGHSSVTYIGDGGTQKITGMGFQPDLVWIKTRNTSTYHNLFDSLRTDVNGMPARLYPSETLAEEPSIYSSETGNVKYFESDGFVLGNGGNTNTNGNSYVAWGWDAGDGDPVSNTDGSITSTVKASTTNGFGIVSYTGTGANATVGHGLSSAPDFIIVKSRTHASSWRVWVTGFTGDQFLTLDTTNAVGTQATAWNSTTPTSSVFSLGSAGDTNRSAENFIAYCFHDVTGKQKFGTYTGDGTSDGSLEINVGFRPGWLMIKRTDSTSNWIIMDGTRNPLNPVTQQLYADTSDDEDTEAGGRVTFTDTGFAHVNSGGGNNANGATYIYAAFAGSYSDYITDYNTDGSIDSRVKANDTTGFSIVGYTGTGSAGDSFGHGLGVTPDMIFIKDRSAANSWTVWHSAIMTNAGYLVLDGTQAANTTDTGYWNATAPSSSVVTLGTRARVNTNTDNYIAYCWAEKSGYSKFGDWTGTGSTFKITTGFKPALVIVKRTSTTGDWILIDGTRDVSDPRTVALQANNSGTEFDSSSYALDFLDDGFNVDATTGNMNNSGDTYIYAAFADTREAAFWLDQSGNDNDWQPVNLDHNDTVADSPTDNFATINPLGSSTGLATISDGNLVITGTASNEIGKYPSTIGVSSGQYYAEFTISNNTSTFILGVSTVPVRVDNTNQNGNETGTTKINMSPTSGSSSIVVDAVSVTSGLDAVNNHDVIGIALDADASKVYFYKNGSSFGSASGYSVTYADFDEIFFIAGSRQSSVTKCNFGQQPFVYGPPE